MKTMMNAVKTMMLSACMMLLFTLSANAQDKMQENAKKVTDSMKVRLSLNDDQYQKVYDANLAFLAKAKEGRKQEGVARADKREGFKAAREEREARLKAVLTEEQFKTFQETRKENRLRAKDAVKAKRSR